jgi:hypothetical protein
MAYLRGVGNTLHKEATVDKYELGAARARVDRAHERDNARFDREFDGRPRPWVPDASDLEEGEPCDTCGEVVTDFNRHNDEAFKRHLEITGELHVLDCPACGKPTDPDVDEFLPGFGWYHARCREEFKAGERVELVSTSDAYTRLRPGARGTVLAVRGCDAYPEPAIVVAWDDGSSLAMLPDSGDQIRRVGA